MARKLQKQTHGSSENVMEENNTILSSSLCDTRGVDNDASVRNQIFLIRSAFGSIQDSFLDRLNDTLKEYEMDLHQKINILFESSRLCNVSQSHSLHFPTGGAPASTTLKPLTEVISQNQIIE
jgi:hypothetical protein